VEGERTLDYQVACKEFSYSDEEYRRGKGYGFKEQV
jgi:hypothetical protein